MTDITPGQIRNFRLRTHQLDGSSLLHPADSPSALSARILEGASLCGFQNSPPGTWVFHLFSRIPGLQKGDPERLLLEEKTLLQAWSFRGAPVVFPTGESPAFLQALIPQGKEEWIYTHGIGLALNVIPLSLEALLDMLIQVILRLDDTVILSKSTLDQTLAEWMIPLLPPSCRSLWNSPSMYGDPARQTVGGAVVSFLLRPCSFLGLVVFGRRRDNLPTFTSRKSWVGQAYQPVPQEEAVKQLVRKYLHAYGPSGPNQFAAWLGCSPGQSRRMWKTLSPEMEPVTVSGKKAFLLRRDLEDLLTPVLPCRSLVLLSPHDPYLDCRDRWILQPDVSLQRKIWKTVSNPGAILENGAVIGIWNCRKKSGGLDIQIQLFPRSDQSERPDDSFAPPLSSHLLQQEISLQIQQYAAFREEAILRMEFI